MSSYQSFVLAGGGHLGGAIARVFSEAGTPLTIFTRASGSTLSPELASLPHITSKAVDYASESSLASALAGVDVVISTSGRGGLDPQLALVDAAKKAGVKLFVPDEFGSPSQGHVAVMPVHMTKQKIQEHLKSLGLPYVLIWPGGFFHWAAPTLGYSGPDTKYFDIVGTGETINSWTNITDIARFLHHILTSLPPNELEWRSFRIEGERKSLIQQGEVIAKHVGKDIPTQHRDLDKVKAEVATAGFAGFMDWIRVMIESGHMSVRWDQTQQKELEKNDNDVWPGWNPRTFEASVKAVGGDFASA